MSIAKRTIAGVLAAGLLVGTMPASAVRADGGASTRNILFGIGAAAGTLIIINHNRQVHEKYAQDAQTEAALAAQRNDAQAAYTSEKKANDNLAAANAELKKEVAYQHSIIDSQNSKIAMLKSSTLSAPTYSAPARVAAAPPTNGTVADKSTARTVAVVSYGWGTI
jgi:acyl-CoA synthetase (AMP-forming)/AMP-acid ligase II